jgi:hypothetical protein
MDLAHPGPAQGDHVFLAPDTIEIEQAYYDLPGATLTGNRGIRVKFFRQGQGRALKFDHRVSSWPDRLRLVPL